MFGTSTTLFQQLTFLKHQLKEKYKESAQETWDNIVENIDTQDDASKFFKSIKRFQGNTKQRAPYIRDENDKKYTLLNTKNKYLGTTGKQSLGTTKTTTTMTETT